MNEIYMAGASVGSLEEEYVLDALRNGWYEDKYYYVERLEREFAKHHSRKYALMTPNCTTSLHLVLAALGIGAGDEVIVPECTWIATASPVVYTGATPIFCDIDEDNWCINLESLETNVTENTKVVIAVDLFGNMPRMDELQVFCDEHGLLLIEDAAESLGSSYRGVPAGKFGTASVFSFHNTKTMSTGEGGMLLLDDDELYERCVVLRDHGRGPNTKPYFNDTVGFKYMPFNIQAALGLAQFHRLDELVGIKRKHLDFYRNELKDLNVVFNSESNDIVNGAWITAMVLDKKYGMHKNDFIEMMNEIGVPVRPFFYPLSSIPAFDCSDFYEKRNPISYDVSSRGVNLPGAANLTDEQLQFICDSIRSVLK